MLKTVIERFLLLCVGITVGWFLSVAVSFLWFMFVVVTFGYGDSAPMWYVEIQGAISYAIIAVSLLTGIIASQWLYNYARKKGRHGAM
jgi:hypothetical protein